MAKKKAVTTKTDDVAQSQEAADKEDPSPSENEDEDELICCCLCYSAVDYSDKSYFCQEARDADSDLDEKLPLLLPIALHDPNNALVFCDGCDRPYHQRCHFVPAIHLPRGDWHCLICTTTPKLLEHNSNTPAAAKSPAAKKQTKKDTKQKQTKKKQTKHQLSSSSWTRKQLSSELYQMDQPGGGGALELKWEYDVRQYKLAAMKQELRRLKGALGVQMQAIRLSQMAMTAFTSSRRQPSIATLLKSQELCQTLVKLASAKLRVRVLLQSLETYRKGDDDDDKWKLLQTFLTDHPDERKAWFPFQHNAERRMPPRLKDDIDGAAEALVVPKEIHLEKEKAVGNKKKGKTTSNKKNKASSNTVTAATTGTKKKDDDSGISLDDLKCCICFKGEATDDNDLLLCDGQGCFRAHHMHCLAPIMTPALADQTEDWFCPLCTTLAKLVADVQSEFTGDEWYCEDAGESVASWEQVNDVFPESPKEYEMAIKWKEGGGVMDDETRAYLKNLFGDDDDAARYEHGDDGADGGGVVEEEDDEEDDDFDPIKAKKSNQEDDDVDDDASSNATLNDMSSVELNIGRKELDALSGGEESSDEDDDDDDDDNGKSKSSQKKNGDKARRSRRIRSARTSRTNTDDDESSDAAEPSQQDIGKLDEGNIVRGKRRRRRIDYRLLNDSMFGKLSAKDKAKMDDTDDFQYKHKGKDTTSESESSNDESSSDENEGDAEDDKEEVQVQEGEEENEGATSKEEVSVSSEGDTKKKAALKKTKNRKKKTTSKAKQP
eukprot:CAMPEP_0119018852 /NCGR_PEP_ID=MMETSP1176-20130426/20385_1 /TAXON_ID=265551 /ORGANISM="Synedropsis recta cf, Strain CCMP1620" /LENGTH=775 /DNA_ID=CAMNT_0006972937 /DNA_START=29 /DNA_END=2353 /DNA_ORIENTATION=+